MRESLDALDRILHRRWLLEEYMLEGHLKHAEALGFMLRLVSIGIINPPLQTFGLIHWFPLGWLVGAKTETPAQLLQWIGKA